MRALRTISVAGAVLVGSGGAGYHVVHPGDSLSGLAARNHTTVKALADANGIRDPNMIRIGQRLVIPGPDGTAPAAAKGAPGTHIVQRGETLAQIAAAAHTTVAYLAAVNGIVDIHKLYVGSQLRLSGSTARPSVNGGGGVYVVAKGDTLAEIASKFHTTVAGLAKANGIKNPSLVRIGARLNVPGSWRCPVAGPTKFINDWGFPRSGGRYHQGNDMMAATGTPVVAPVNGTVTRKQGKLAGNQVMLKGDDGFTYFGMHLSRYGAQGRVGAGTVIGYVGNTGDADGGAPHLHFEIHPGNGDAINPYPTILAACRG